MAKVRRDVWQCDAPGCKVEVPAGEDTPDGYSGKVSTAGGTGCHNQPWFACANKHIEPAVRSVAESAQRRAWGREHETRP